MVYAFAALMRPFDLFDVLVAFHEASDIAKWFSAPATEVLARDFFHALLFEPVDRSVAY